MAEIKAPSDCLSGEIDDFVKFVIEWGKVQGNGLKGRVQHARFLAFYRETTELVGVGGIKQRPIDYRKGIFGRAKSDLDATSYKLELGWVAVKKDFRCRGIGGRIVEELLEKVNGDKVYATTSVDWMKRKLKSLNFRKSGEEFPSKITKPPLVLLVRDGSTFDGGIPLLTLE